MTIFLFAVMIVAVSAMSQLLVAQLQKRQWSGAFCILVLIGYVWALVLNK